MGPSASQALRQCAETRACMNRPSSPFSSYRSSRRFCRFFCSADWTAQGAAAANDRPTCLAAGGDETRSSDRVQASGPPSFSSARGLCGMRLAHVCPSLHLSVSASVCACLHPAVPGSRRLLRRLPACLRALVPRPVIPALHPCPRIHLILARPLRSRLDVSAADG